MMKQGVHQTQAVPNRLEQGPIVPQDALFQPVLLRSPVAAATHPSWQETVDAGAMVESELLEQSKSGQHHVDLKPFTGRGAGRRTTEAQKAVDRIHAEMRQLVAKTRLIHGRQIQLGVHERASSGQLSVRWRRVGFVETKSHIAWRDLEQWLAPLPDWLAASYREVNQQALLLNEQEKQARAALRALQVSDRHGLQQREILLPTQKRRGLPTEI